ncbi:MAG: membrane protein insertase YidC [Actinomycetota bacterium]|jgi:YidC/Oxa1 family membrane protein insertase|nr:membrane protein insertase YidC [Rubrobacter sp.]MDQ3509537.1 membrane protein insertase YidC [Actinomycetota bacterium]
MLDMLRNLFDPLFDLLGGLLLTFHTDLGAPWWLSIIMLTVIVRSALLPLAIRQTKNMRAMQNLRPDLERLQKKHKEDPRKLQQETMKLHKERNVSPLGGCLPILVQIPILMVLYFTLKEFETLSSFQSGGLLWFTDLTAADPFFILPIAYVLTMMASQEVVIRNSPMQSGQQKMMRLLPIAFGFFLARFPAGLLVYWVASNAISLIQNLAIYRAYPAIAHEEDPKEIPEKKPAAPKKRRKKKSKSRR